MSRENVEIVRRSIEAWNAFFKEGADPLPGFQEFCDPEVEIDFSRRLVDAEIYRGYEGGQRFLKETREPWEDLRIEPEELLDGRDRVVVFSRVVGNAKQSGITVDTPVAHVCRIRAGRLVRIEYFGEDRAGALRAAGLSE